jgi:hypothetical protein
MIIYTYRPSELKHMNLYEWTLRCQRQKYNPRASRKKDVDDLGDDEDINTVAANVFYDSETPDTSDDGRSNIQCDSGTEENDQSDAETLVEDTIPNKLQKNMYKFIKKHPLYDSHVVILKDIHIA